jgi:hypothetical protein
MPAIELRTRFGTGHLLSGHAQDVPIRSAAVPDSGRSRQQVPGPSPDLGAPDSGEESNRGHGPLLHRRLTTFSGLINLLVTNKLIIDAPDHFDQRQFRSAPYPG